MFVEEHEDGLGVDALEGEAGGVGQAVDAVAVDLGAGDGGEDAFLEFVAQGADFEGLVLHEFGGEFARLAEGDDGGDVLGAGAPAVLLSAANQVG